jgi:nitroreductase
LNLTKQLLKLDPELHDSRWVVIANSLRDYRSIHYKEAFFKEYSEDVTNILSHLACIADSPAVKPVISGIKEYTSYGEFFKQRVSVRNFSRKSVAMNLIINAVELAKFTPSVCNRQPWKIKILSTFEDKKIALDHQNGNKGFGHEVDKVIIIGADLRSFIDVIERNEGFIDLGMFSMSFILALQEQGLSTCCLNWCVNPEIDQKLHQDLNLPDWFRVGYLLAVGYSETNSQTAASIRRNTSDFIL